jgi:hypothetical protein
MANLLIGLGLSAVLILQSLALFALWQIKKAWTSTRVDETRLNDRQQSSQREDQDPEGNWFVSDAEQAQQEKALMEASQKRAAAQAGARPWLRQP